MQYITFPTQADFDTWHAEMNVLKGLSDGRGTDTYTSAKEGTDGLFYAAIRDRDVVLLEDMASPYTSVVGPEVKQAAMPQVDDEDLL